MRTLTRTLSRSTLRLGFLNGKQGFLFHFLQGCWYRLLMDVILDDLRWGGGVEVQRDKGVRIDSCYEGLLVQIAAQASAAVRHLS